MDSRHGHRGSRTGLLVFALLAVTATLSCTAPADTEGADDSTAPSPAASDPRAAAPVSDASRSSFTLFESFWVSSNAFALSALIASSFRLMEGSWHQQALIQLY